MKTCTTCKQELPIELFGFQNFKKKYRKAVCKPCTNVYQNKWKRKNRDKDRNFKYKSRYGIDITYYEKLLNEQDGKCALCKSDSPKRGKYFLVDHCHKTNKIRGLLCDGCNKGLGHFMDDKDVLLKAINYLELVD